MASTYVALHRRGMVSVTGADASNFLQNIISNDIFLLRDRPFLHACLLTAQGKFLHDFYVSKTDNGFILECEGDARSHDLAKRLNLYRLRADVQCQVHDFVTVYVRDDMRSFERPEDGDEIAFNAWDRQRIMRGVADGSRDAEVGMSTLAEVGLDQVAVSYSKGCFVGQELVARMHNRNLGKKHLVPARFKSDPPCFGTLLDNGGIMRSSCSPVGLVVINKEHEITVREKQTDDSEIYLLGL